MDEELREKVADILGGLSPVFKAECVEELLALIASVRVREQREAFAAGAAWDAREWTTDLKDAANEAAIWRYPDA